MTKEKNDMTNEYSFKVGDRVTLAGDTNAVGTIRYVGKETCIVDFGMGDSTVGYKDIQPLDRRTAFLTRLQSLLREFDASFIAHKTDMPVSVYFKGNVTPAASIGKEINKGCGVVVKAGYIMDFDKE